MTKQSLPPRHLCMAWSLHPGCNCAFQHFKKSLKWLAAHEVIMFFSVHSIYKMLVDYEISWVTSIHIIRMGKKKIQNSWPVQKCFGRDCPWVIRALLFSEELVYNLGDCMFAWDSAGLHLSYWCLVQFLHLSRRKDCVGAWEAHDIVILIFVSKPRYLPQSPTQCKTN